MTSSMADNDESLGDQQTYEAESVDDSDSPLTEKPTLPPQKSSDASMDEATLPPRDS